MWRRAQPVASRRLKSYRAASGYVYEYYFLERVEDEYRFACSATRRDFAPVRVQIDRHLLTSCAGRELSAVEEYAVAKMSLFQAFDCRPDPAAMQAAVIPAEPDFVAILGTLDLL